MLNPAACMWQSMEFENTLALSSTQLSEIINVDGNGSDPLFFSEEYIASVLGTWLLF